MPTIDEVKKYWNSQPCGLLHGSAPVGSPEYYEQLTARRYFVQPHIPSFAAFAQWNGKRVLEIGCGCGTDARQFATWGAEYVGVDLSEKSLELAAQQFQTFRLPGKFVCGNAEQLSEFLPAQRFDLVYAFGSLHHTPFPNTALREMRCYMDDSSELRIMVYAENSWKAAMIDAGLDQYEAQANCPLANRYTQQQAQKLLEDNGFAVIEMWQDHIFPYQVEPYKRLQYAKKRWFDAMPNAVFAALEQSLGWHLLIKARLAQRPQTTSRWNEDNR